MWLWQLFELPKWHAKDPATLRTSKWSLGVYDLIAAAEWRESTSRYSALEQSDRTHGRPTQASPTLHHRKQTRVSVSVPNAFGIHGNAPQVYSVPSCRRTTGPMYGISQRTPVN